MHLLRRSRWDGDDDTHRWFPEWADRIERAGVALESDRNSYSAGGYAEEFGYRGQPGLPTPAPLLAGQPEGHKVWRIQRGALHPGYPECARPLDRDGELTLFPVNGARGQERHVPLHPYAGELRVIRLARPQSGYLEQIAYLWRGLRVRARHLDGF